MDRRIQIGGRRYRPFPGFLVLAVLFLVLFAGGFVVVKAGVGKAGGKPQTEKLTAGQPYVTIQTPDVQHQGPSVGSQDTHDQPQSPSVGAQHPNIRPQGTFGGSRYVVTRSSLVRLLGGNGKEKIVLLTFDDAPRGESTRKILDVLERHRAPALFFVNGTYAEKRPELLREIARRGHGIGNHTWSHARLTRIPCEQVREEIVRLNDFVERETGIRPAFFRPPYGKMSPCAYSVLEEEGMVLLQWTWSSEDWRRKSAKSIVQSVVSHVHPGATLLFHDLSLTARALPEILEELERQGYRFVLPDEPLPEDFQGVP
ncbi:polysaccharide deacetylase family protein [Brockia lithotrophica]|uniref:Peptidoglycan/xylan/chitin deacetylase (PgdA/CDA1 family) n=1 Tax=Brockia lithotrophica TaxID=933949 RepID=A0A660L5J4_9BACL|nr:polysaccharide deacetylase family protein [Brockia lithotrophica]RKQ88688.1 peptidoglycan/xylan/chitin deacetylase (PgdA/CDA1 family) [Brockia lithotrophica]